MAGLSPEVRLELGDHLRALRRSHELTLAALAGEVGVTPSALSQIERGKSEPSLGTLWRLGRALNASLFDFFARQEARPSTSRAPARAPWSSSSGCATRRWRAARSGRSTCSSSTCAPARGRCGR